MGKQKYYVVWKGKKPGVYDSWQKCQEEIKNIKGARFKSFDDVKKADNAYSIGYDEYKKTNPIINEGDGPNLDSISVDAASSGNPGKMEYRGVDTKTKKVLFKMGPFNNATNNIGEFLALVHGVAMMEKESDKKIIYSDSITAISWVRKKRCQTKLKKNKENEEVFDLIARAILWLKKNNYSIIIKKWETKLWGEIPADFGRK
tara:strand:+ start:1285 stop:1893 length:609 start_codon:yes stop_codon:yes gene_type:complete